jgi:hypothetical protein
MTWTILTTAATLVTASLPVVAQHSTFVPADSGARILSQHRIGVRQLDLTVKSPALSGPVKVRVLLPKAWKAKTRSTWPVLYAYQGGQDNYTSWTKNSHIKTLAAERKKLGDAGIQIGGTIAPVLDMGDDAEADTPAGDGTSGQGGALT